MELFVQVFIVLWPLYSLHVARWVVGEVGFISVESITTKVEG